MVMLSPRIIYRARESEQVLQCNTRVFKDRKAEELSLLVVAESLPELRVFENSFRERCEITHP